MKVYVQSAKKCELTLGTVRSYWNILGKDVIWLAVPRHKGTNGVSGEE